MDLTPYVRAISSVLAETRMQAQQTAVILIICIRDRTKLRHDYEDYSVAAGFLTAIELDDIISSLRSCGFYVEHFDDEITFIRWVLSGNYTALPHRFKIVYTEAGSGTGPGRRTLIPAFCRHVDIPTVNSDAYSCAINRQKFHWSHLLSAFGFTVPQSWSYDSKDGWFNSKRPTYGSLVIGKSTYEDCSLGVSTNTVGEFSPELERHIADASRALQQPMTVQELIAGAELEVPVIELDRRIAPTPIAILKANGDPLHNDVLVYDEVWDDHYCFAMPQGLSDEEARNIADIAVSASRVLGFRGFSRIDFRIGPKNQPYIIDVSTTPHLTRCSSYAFLFEFLGFTYGDMLNLMIASGLNRHGMFSILRPEL